MRPALLDEALRAWEDARGGVIDELRAIGTSRFAERPFHGARTPGELAIHIMEVSLMMTGELTRDVSDFTRAPFDELLSEYRGVLEKADGPEQILELLHSTLAEGRNRFESVGEQHMLGPVRQFDGSTATRLSWLYHGIAQEMYHRGQLAHYARMMGEEPALTKKIRTGSA